MDAEHLPGLGDEPPAMGRRPVLCRACGRPLTDREARLYGLGRDCREKLRERVAPRPGDFTVDQDTLFRM